VKCQITIRKDSMNDDRKARAREQFDLFQKGWSDWIKLDTLAPKDIPAAPGVYQLATTSPFPRVKGATCILYVGSADDGAYGLRGRLKALTPNGKGRELLKSRYRPILHSLGESLWLRTKVTLPGDAEETERQLLDDYIDEHLELPPCNRNLPKKIKR